MWKIIINLLKHIRRILYRILSCYEYYIRYPKLCKTFEFDVMTPNETIDVIISQKKSVTRFGDGELLMEMRRGSPGFQKRDEKLSRRLEEILNSKADDILVCLTDIMLSTNGLVKCSALYCRSFVCREYNRLKTCIPTKRIYGNTNFTRFYADFANKDHFEMAHKIEHIRQIWGGYSIYIIEGEFTRSGIGNNLYENTKEIHRIICPATNAFSKYEEILRCACDSIPHDEDVLVLCLLGPTATILAYDLHKYGYRAIDMGHIDIEYEWFLKGVQYKTEVSGKSCNECGVNYLEHPIISEAYEKQIIAKILN